jgi:hypothetical protein
VSWARAGLPAVELSLAPRGNRPVGVIVTSAVGTAEAAASGMLSFDPALASITDPGVGVCQLTEPGSLFAAVPGTSKSAPNAAASANGRTSF